MEHLILFGTSACHLCEEAEVILLHLKEAGLNFSFEKVDIAEDDSLFKTYGLTIPVLRDSAGTEINWPFTGEAVARLLSA